jgi:hypothetical protein
MQAHAEITRQNYELAAIRERPSPPVCRVLTYLVAAFGQAKAGQCGNAETQSFITTTPSELLTAGELPSIDTSDICAASPVAGR